MRKKSIQLTTAQFARLHTINKRTLHYYDSIGLFSPYTKGENGYRYYNISQSLNFEHIRMLRDLNMSIEEIELYLKNPTPDKFLKIAEKKETEIDAQIQKLKYTKKILHTKKEQINFCQNLQEQEIHIIECKEEKILVIPYDFAGDDVSELFSYIKDTWSIEQIRLGIGSFIALDKVIDHNFNVYDGLYSPALNRSSSAKSIIKPKGRYLCGYQKGIWDQLPAMYQKMLDYAKKNNLKLIGYAYEIGLNEFVASNPNDYITKIMIKIEENNSEVIL